MLGLVKSLLVSLSDKCMPNTCKLEGVLASLPDGEELGGALYNSCVGLIQHIMSRQSCVAISGASPSTREKQSKEVSLFSDCYPTLLFFLADRFVDDVWLQVRESSFGVPGLRAGQSKGCG